MIVGLGIRQRCSCLLSSNVREYQAIVYKSNGQPEDVLRLGPQADHQLTPSEALVEWLAAPINPADINQIQGTYGIKAELPAVPGNEGVGVVKALGEEAGTRLKPGDWVVPLCPGAGTWREASFHASAELHKIPQNLPLGAAASLAVNPPTAKRLLQVINLKAGDVVIQNGANSFVGQFLIQIAAQRGLKTVNLVRDRPQLKELKQQLTELGADLVTTEESLRKDLGLSKPKLAINSVGGKHSTVIARSLGKNGTLVTYGGLSKEPVTLPTGPFIFKGLKAQGFWLSGGSRTDAEAATDIDEAAQLWLQGKVTAEFDFFDLDAFEEALKKPSSGLLARKTVLLTKRGRNAWTNE